MLESAIASAIAATVGDSDVLIGFNGDGTSFKVVGKVDTADVSITKKDK